MLVVVGWVVFRLAGFLECEDETGNISEELRYAILKSSCKGVSMFRARSVSANEVTYWLLL
jgi:hypothetical protein